MSSKMSMISSPANPNIKRIRALRQRKERARSGMFFVEGIRIVGEAVQAGAVLETLLVAPELLSSPFAYELVAAQRQAGVACLEVTPQVFQSLSSRDGPQGIGAVVRQQQEPLTRVTLTRGECWVALVAVQDPGNLGTILRTCDAVGVAGVLLLDDTTDAYDPAALRASMGAVFTQRLVQASFADFAAWKEQQNCQVIGTSDAAQRDYQAIAYPPPLIILMGSERQGLSPQQQAICDAVVSIPMVGHSDSLNLAVATGVVLYEMFNQRRRYPADQAPPDGA